MRALIDVRSPAAARGASWYNGRQYSSCGKMQKNVLLWFAVTILARSGRGRGYDELEVVDCEQQINFSSVNPLPQVYLLPAKF